MFYGMLDDRFYIFYGDVILVPEIDTALMEPISTLSMVATVDNVEIGSSLNLRMMSLE